ncbi:MAG: hypothetical protein NT030_03390 [Candidatus Saganbacteria bacterium]|nr:hypothetical protein [Candidatus Saganbacteria bacterium]
MTGKIKEVCHRHVPYILGEPMHQNPSIFSNKALKLFGKSGLQISDQKIKKIASLGAFITGTMKLKNNNVASFEICRQSLEVVQLDIFFQGHIDKDNKAKNEETQKKLEAIGSKFFNIAQISYDNKTLLGWHPVDHWAHPTIRYSFSFDKLSGLLTRA